MHPLRCFAFVHKPSFMRQLDRGFASDDESALLHIICAHGAKFLLLGSGAGDLTPPPPPVGLRGAGNQWARRAEFLLLANFGKISVQRLMVSSNGGGWGKSAKGGLRSGVQGLMHIYDFLDGHPPPRLPLPPWRVRPGTYD